MEAAQAVIKRAEAAQERARSATQRADALLNRTPPPRAVLRDERGADDIVV